MKKYTILFALISFVILASCNKEDEQPNTTVAQEMSSGQVFYATTESQKQPDTKVYADENMQVLWNEDDRISVFNRNTYNYEYMFMGEDGDNSGSFEEIPVSGLISGNSLSNIYAIYPYSKSNRVNNAGTAVTMILPSEQVYKANSFGIGANSMIAVTESNFLAFKNVCGYLSIRLYGDNISVSSITLSGNNGEKIAGKASMAVSTTTAPITTMDNSATNAITIVCDPPVQIGSSSDNYTDFWFAIPPTTFSKGFTISVTDTQGGTYVKSTTKKFTINRNQIEWMSPLKVVPSFYGNDYLEIIPDTESYSVAKEGDTLNIRVLTDLECNVSSDFPWIRVEPSLIPKSSDGVAKSHNIQVIVKKGYYWDRSGSIGINGLKSDSTYIYKRIYIDQSSFDIPDGYSEIQIQLNEYKYNTVANSITEIYINDVHWESPFSEMDNTLWPFNGIPGSSVGRYIVLPAGINNFKLCRNGEVVYDNDIVTLPGKQQIYFYCPSKSPIVIKDNEYPYWGEQQSYKSFKVRCVNLLLEDEVFPSPGYIQYQYRRDDETEWHNVGNPIYFGEATDFQEIIINPEEGQNYQRIYYRVLLQDGSVAGIIDYWNGYGGGVYLHKLANNPRTTFVTTQWTLCRNYSN